MSYKITIRTSSSTMQTNSADLDALLAALGDEPFGITYILQVAA